MLVCSPDRLTRKYGFQVLPAEELSRRAVELVFLRAPSGATAEDQLLAQSQGMIAEYERARIAGRSRGGNRRAGLWACCGSKGPGPRFRQ